MTPTILAIGKSLPAYSMNQMEIAKRLTDIMDLTDEEAWMLEKIYKNSAIQKRYSVLPDIIQPACKQMPVIGMSERNAHYRKEAPKLAEHAAVDVLKNWNRSPNDITHVISVSCTGVMTPGLEFLIANKLNLPLNTTLLGVNFMGCHGAFKALKVASKIAKDNPKNRILVVATELCSLHFKTRGDLESVVIQSLFADGSAAVIIGSDLLPSEHSLFEFIDEQCLAIENSQEDMTWHAADEGFDMTLSAQVPHIISCHIKPFAEKLTGEKTNVSDCEWAIHPGGKAIVESVEKALQIDRSATISSWNVLNKYGNLSSATFLYVLEDIANRGGSKEKVIGLGFGPGISVEGISLKKTATFR